MSPVLSGSADAAGKPDCRLALAALAMAVIAAAGAIFAGFGSRFGFWHFRTGFGILRWSAYVAFASIPFSLAVTFVTARAVRWRCFFISLVALLIGSIVFGVPLKWRLAAKKVPPIHDISTDLMRPPAFVAILPLRKGAANPAEYGGPAVAALQQEAYPYIKTLIFDFDAITAFRRASDIARRLGWDIVAEVPSEGRIEATDTTFWFGFIDDIIIRVTPAGPRSLIDVRSVSRVGKSDAGTNAARTRRFLSIMNPTGR